MEPELQGRLAAMLPAMPTGGRAEELLALAKRHQLAARVLLPDGSSCKRGDAFLRHDVDCGYGETCKGKTCCLQCPHAKAKYYACDRACSKAKAARKEQRDEEAAREAKRLEEVKRKDDQELQARAARLAAAADASRA